jgi:hypothetical protein
MSQREEPAVTARFSAFSVTGMPPVKIFVQNADEVVPLLFNRRTRGNTIKYQGPNPVTFFRQVPQEDGTLLPVPVGQVTIPPGLDKVLLLFIPNFRGPDTPHYRIFAVNDAVENFPAGSLRVFNGMGEPIYGMIGDKPRVLSPGFNEPLSLLEFHGRIRERMISHEDGSTHKETDVDSTAGVQLARKKDGRFEYVYDSPLRIHPKARYILLVFPAPDDPEGNQLYTQIIYESMP